MQGAIILGMSNFWVMAIAFWGGEGAIVFFGMRRGDRLP